MLNSEMMQVIEMAEMYLDHGLPLVAGGQIDQPKAFMDITRFIARERIFWENAQQV